MWIRKYESKIYLKYSSWMEILVEFFEIINNEFDVC